MKKHVQNLGPAAGQNGESRNSNPSNKPPMKKIFTVLCVLVSMICTAVAQPAMISKGNVDGLTYVNDDPICQEQNTRDVLEVEIVSNFGDVHYQHPQHPATGLACPFSAWFNTAEMYEWYLWETDLDVGDDWMFENFEILCYVDRPGYIKLTVGDADGNTASDSIWFNVKEPTSPMENFIMEIGEDLTPTFSGIATGAHTTLYMARIYEGFTGNFDELFLLSPGEWTYNDQGAVYQEDTLWTYFFILKDTCDYKPRRFLVPGMLLDAKNEGDDYYLDMKTILQTADGFYHNSDPGGLFVYFVYTVDSQGQRHHFTDIDGNLVILPEDATTWQIPGKHVDPHYQCGVAKVLEDGTYELLSLSNKVENPLLDTDGIEEHQAAFSLYPNPAQGHFTVEGTGTMTVTNVLGQTVLTREIDGKETVELPQGLYFVRLNGATRKIVVE